MVPLFSLLAMLVVVASTSPASAQEPADPLAAIAGRWQVSTPSTGQVSTTCEAPQTFTVSADRRYVDLEERAEGETLRVRYIVLQAQPGRLLMFIEGEDRLTQSGDPVLWWAVFSGPDQFRWRRYDWAPSSQTAAEWGRCPN